MNPYSPDPVLDATTLAVQDRERAFIRSVYGWMFGGLLLTALAAFWVFSSQPMQQLILANPIVYIGLIVVELGAVIYLSVRVQKMSPAAAATVFFGFSVLNGLTLSAILFAYTFASIVQAFVVASVMFGAMAIYGLATRRDLTSWGSFFFMGLIGIIIASVVNIFMKSSALEGAISLIGVFVFLGLTAYHNQKLKAMARIPVADSTNYAVVGALGLYLDFINLFLMLLRLLGNRR